MKGKRDDDERKGKERKGKERKGKERKGKGTKKRRRRVCPSLKVSLSLSLFGNRKKKIAQQKKQN